MKMLPRAAIGPGTFCLLPTVAQKFVGANQCKIAPANYVGLAAASFLLPAALMCHGRSYCSNNGQN